MKKLLSKIVSFKIPCCILDLHVHGRDMAQRYKTTVEQVLYEAINSLISVVAFMPNTKPELTTIGALDAYLELKRQAKKTHRVTKRQYIWFGVTNENLDECKRALQYPEVIGLKVYSEKGIHQDTLRKALVLGKKAKKVIAVHCDEPSIIEKFGYTTNAEVEYVKRVIKVAKFVPMAKIMICHVSCAASARLILQAQADGLHIAMELCIQYLWFDQSNFNRRTDLPVQFYNCLNRLRDKNDREFLVSLLLSDNKLIFVHSDSACHTEQEKLDGANGFPSNQQLVNGLVTLAIQHGIAEERVAELLSYNAIDFFGLPLKKELVEMKWQLKPDDKVYNNGVVINPWLGLMLYQPIIKT